MTALVGPASGGVAFAESELAPHHFKRITDLLYEHSGIRMRPGKEGLVRARLARRLRVLALSDFDAYLKFVETEPSRREFAEMIDALTTNKTSFLREVQHFDYLRDRVLPALHGPVRLWSAGCSSGEEPYTLAMLLNEAYGDIAKRDVRILATDLSHRVLATAKAGVYPGEVMSDVPAPWLARYWARRGNAAGHAEFTAGPALTRLVSFARLNLMESWPMKGPFDAIFCRNVILRQGDSTETDQPLLGPAAPGRALVCQSQRKPHWSCAPVPICAASRVCEVACRPWRHHVRLNALSASQTCRFPRGPTNA
jgi:chemotaxis protein methyltransferase CheR